MAKSPICVTFRLGSAETLRTQYFNDWYDFADWLKQQNVHGITVTIVHWEYIR